MRQTLIDTLSGAGKPYRLHENPDGSTVLVLLHGGRVLGLFAPQSEENFYWTHPALQSAESAAEFYRGDQWHNSGGDRTWLAPEVDFFFPNFPKTDVYFQPRGLDPGDYRLVEDGAGERLVNRATLLLSRSKAEVELEITKSIGPAPNPLRCERGLADLPVAYAGYTQRTTLALVAGGSKAASAIGLWNLIQMPHGGDLLVPTYARSEPKVLFGTVGPGDLRTEDRLIRYRMRSSGEQKIGIRAVAVGGRVGYCYPARDGRWALVVRNIFVNPSGLYVDVPWSDTADFGYAIQACNVNSQLGAFSELEYHVPAIGPGTGAAYSEDVAQVWAFRGDRQAIERVAGSLLAQGVSVT
jgi:hypothetical protein